MSNIKSNIIDDILRREGFKLTDDPADRGGATKFGITQRSWDDYVAKDPAHAPVRSVEALNEEMARAFYATEYVAPLSWIKSKELLSLMVDSAIQHGIRRAICWLQTAAGTSVDGAPGPKTIDAIGDEYRQNYLYAEVLRRRIMFYARIVSNELSQARFLKGWMSRVCEFIR